MPNSLLQIDLPWTQQPPYPTKLDEAWQQEYQPVLFLPFNEGAGKTGFDRSRSQINGTLNSGVTYGQSLLGGVTSFASTNSDLTLSATVSLGTIHTISFWYLETTAGQRQIVSSLGTPDINVRIGGASTVVAYNQGASNSASFSGLPTTTTGTWYFFVFTRNNSTTVTCWIFSLTGQLLYSGTASLTTNSAFSYSRFGNTGSGAQIIGMLAQPFSSLIPWSFQQACDQAAKPFSWAKKRRFYLPIASAAGGGFTQSLSGTLSFAGAIGKGTSVKQTATANFSGATNKATAIKQSATLTTSGSIKRAIGKGLSAVLSFTGSQKLATAITKTATLSFAGSQKLGIGKAVSGVLSFSGTAKRLIGVAMAAALAFSSGMKRSIAAKLSAVLSYAGSLSDGAAFSKTLAATLSFAGAVNRGVSARLAATLSFSGAIKRGIAKALSGTLSLSGPITRGVRVRVIGSLRFSGSVVSTLAGYLLYLRRWFQ